MIEREVGTEKYLHRVAYEQCKLLVRQPKGMIFKTDEVGIIESQPKANPTIENQARKAQR